MRINSDEFKILNKSDSAASLIMTSAGSSEEARPVRIGAAQRRFLAEAPAVDVPPEQEIPGQREYCQAIREWMYAQGIQTESWATHPLDPVVCAQNRALKKAALQQVLKTIDSAIEKRPGQFPYHMMRAEVLMGLEMYPQALKEINYCIENFADRGQYWEGVVLPGMPGPDGQPTTVVAQYKMDWNKGDAYWIRYSIRKCLGQEASSEASSDLEMGMALGNWSAQNELNRRNGN